SWKEPKGLAYLEPRDEDSMLRFISHDELFTIDPADVSPLCAEGDIYTLHVIRSDLKNQLNVRTNTCVFEFNLLTGSQRKIFPELIAFINRIRDRYRPLYTE
ncbi:MAG: hypothetical protein ABI778_10665, partial [Ignavibacteriota bacterium]